MIYKMNTNNIKINNNDPQYSINPLVMYKIK